MSTPLAVLSALIPSIGVGALFWLAIRSLLNADRTERAALARMDAAERDAASGANPGQAGTDS